jgi:hypothetical protein
MAGNRWSFLSAMAKVGTAATTARILGSSAALIGSTPRLLASTSAAAQIQEPLIQPSEIRSENGVLRTTITTPLIMKTKA